MKLNTKLSSAANKGSVWRVQPPRTTDLSGPSLPSSGIMTMGYTVTKEAGQSGLMLVSAACVLESNKILFGHATRAQKTEALVAPRLLRDIMQVSLSFSRSPHLCLAHFHASTLRRL